ncbi:MAG: Rab family GTPase [Candidatus Jordarchaeales archaeon]|nr:GTP-binding protein [Candidatus Jordarchaeia archaeon]
MSAYLFKIVMVGDPAVGKTSLVMRYVQGFFQHDYKATVGTQIMSKEVYVKGVTVKLSIWDIGGQEKFDTLAPAYYKGAAGGLAVFDLTRRETFDNIPKWISRMQTYANPNLAIIIVGNKSDLIEERQVSLDEAMEQADKLGFPYVETSAKSGKNVIKIFELIAERIVSRKIE